MDVRVESRKIFCSFAKIGHLGLYLLWKLVHFWVSIWYSITDVVHTLESYLISCGLLKRYKSLDVSMLRYLAIVIESEEAGHTSEIIKLLQWVAAIGVKQVCLYDMEGVIKKSKEAILEACDSLSLREVHSSKPLLDPSQLTLEFSSLADGKEGVTKAANFLFLKYLALSEQGQDQEKLKFNELLMDESLRIVGSLRPDPDLLLVYGPARCHLGFPAWRIRYTEILHMGPLKSMRYGSLVKAIHSFTMVRQNYGK